MDNANNQLELLKTRIIYNEKVFGNYNVYEKVLNRLLEDSKYIALSMRYHYQDFYDMDLPRKYYNWQLRCCMELKELIGSANVKSYSENGLSWTRDSAYLSEQLATEIEPMVGYIGSDDV